MKEYEELYRLMLREHESVFAAQDQTQLAAALVEIAAAGRIFVVGAGREGIAARAFAMRLMHLGDESRRSSHRCQRLWCNRSH